MLGDGGWPCQLFTHAARWYTGPASYHGIFEGHILKEEIEKMARWPNRVESPHPDWVSTRNVEDNNETFGFIDPIPPKVVTDEDDDSASDDSLYNLADNAANELYELDAEIGSKNLLNASPMPPSLQWLASLHGRAQGCGKVRGHFE